ncbi:hypothetical protein IT087_00790 [Candidatus Uhrbacteria bacterium]|nr:hypothetical protein [Candidatus Uhrbacteria bacterium]
MNPNISNLLADAGGAAGIWLVLMRFWTQFRNLAGLLKEAAEWTKVEMQIFASRTVVIATRQIWWVLLPAMAVLAIASSVSAWHIEGSMLWWSLNAAVKLSVLLIAGDTMRRVFRVKHIPENATDADITNGVYGESWLFAPMVRNGLLCLVALAGALLSDTFLLADRVWFFHSLFNAVLFVAALVFTISYLLGVLFGVYALASSGVELGGGAWGGFFVPLATVAIPGLTGLNNRVIQITAEQRSGFRARLRDALVENKLAGGAVALWVTLFLSFHGYLAWLIELSVLVLLIGVLIGYVWVTGKVLLRMAENITIIICTVAILAFFWRMIDAAVLRAPGDHTVMFYERVWSLLLWVGGGFTADAASGPIGFASAVTTTFVFALLVMGAGAVWLAYEKLSTGTLKTVLMSVGVLMLVAGCGMVLVRTAFADPTAPAAASEEASDDNGLGDLIPRHTVNAGSHDGSPGNPCSLSDPSRACR